jgi:hypothetical protein
MLLRRAETSFEQWVLAGSMAVLLLALAVTFLPAASAEEGNCEVDGPDADRYACRTGTFDFIDQSDETVDFQDRNDVVSHALPSDFGFSWYGDAVDTVHINSNGFVCFESACTESSVVDDSWQSQRTPQEGTPNDLLACVWNSLDPTASGATVSHAMASDDGQRKFLITFDGVPFYGDSSSSNSFQIQLHEDGSARCMIERVESTGQDTATGTENSDGTDGVRYAYDEYATENEGVAFDQVPTVPRNAIAEPGPERGEISVCWDKPSTVGTEHLTTFNITRAANEMADTKHWEVEPAETSQNTTDLDTSKNHCFVDSGLGDQSEHAYDVTAISAAGASDASPTVSATTWSLPTEPTNVAANEVSGQVAIELTWESPNETGNADIERFRILRDGNTLTSVPADSTDGTYSHDDTVALSCQVDAYEYEIKAQNEGIDEYGPASRAVTAAIEAGCPSNPRDLEATPGLAEVELAWKPATDNGTTDSADRYNIYRESEPSSSPEETLDADKCDPVCQFTDDGLDHDTNYEYQVTAVSGDDLEGDATNKSDADTYGAPQSVEATWEVGTGISFLPQAVNVTWEPPSGADEGLDFHGYEVYRVDVLRVPFDGSTPEFATSAEVDQDADAIDVTPATSYTDFPRALGYYCYSSAPVNASYADSPGDNDPGVAYEPEVAGDACTEVGDLSSQPAVAGPDAPSNVAAFPLASASPEDDESNVQVCFDETENWGGVGNASFPNGSYRIYDGTEPVTTIRSNETNAGDQRDVCVDVTVSEPEPATEHEMYVSAVSDLGVSEIRDLAQESDKAGPAEVTTVGAPAPPTGLTAQAGSALGVIATAWSASEDPNVDGDEPEGDVSIDNYVLQRKTPSADWDDADEVATPSSTSVADGNTTSNEERGHPASETYEYRVKAVNNANVSSDWSSVASGSAENGQPVAPNALDCTTGGSQGEIDCTVTFPTKDSDGNDVEPRVLTGGSVLAAYDLYERLPDADSPEYAATKSLDSSDSDEYVVDYTFEDYVSGIEVCFRADATNQADLTSGLAPPDEENSEDPETSCATAAS